MKLEINEVHFIKAALEVTSVKVSDARFAADVMTKLDKEFERLAKLQEKKPA